MFAGSLKQQAAVSFLRFCLEQTARWFAVNTGAWPAQGYRFYNFSYDYSTKYRVRFLAALRHGFAGYSIDKTRGNQLNPHA